jgi:putative hydrolase of the HAD superfamily
MFNELDKGGYQTHEIRSEAIRDLNIWHSPKTIEELSTHWQSWVPNNSVPMKSMEECLACLIEMGFRLCLVSNGQSKKQRDKVNKLSLGQYLEAIVISEEVGFKKPDARIFEYALNVMDCKVEESFFVGDHPENDYLGSTSLGFTGIWLEGSHAWPEDLLRPLSVKNLNELCAKVRNLTNKG